MSVSDCSRDKRGQTEGSELDPGRAWPFFRLFLPRVSEGFEAIAFLSLSFFSSSVAISAKALASSESSRLLLPS